MVNASGKMFHGFVCMMVAAASVVLIVGCVSKPVEKKHTPTLMTAQNSDGEVTLSWDSVVGYRYRLYLMDRGDTEWTPFGNTFDGTGERITLEGNSRKKARRYWIQADKITP